MGTLFASCMIGLQGAAAIAYACENDVRRAIYWTAAAVLTAAVSF